MSRLSRRKGCSGEREVVKAFEDWGIGCRRSANQSMGAFQADIADLCLYGLEIWAEVKRQKRPSPIAAYEQAVRDSFLTGRTVTPMAITRADGKQWMVTLSLSDLMLLLGAAEMEHTHGGDPEATGVTTVEG